LIELVLVIVVAVVAVTPLMSLFSDATVNSVKPLIATQATFLAQDKIEEILADAKAAGRGYGYVTSSNYPDVVNPPGFQGFTISVSVSAESLYQDVTFKTVSVTVSNGAIDDVVLTTWVTQ
jgi:hypothetical protein